MKKTSVIRSKIQKPGFTVGKGHANWYNRSFLLDIFCIGSIISRDLSKYLNQVPQQYGVQVGNREHDNTRNKTNHQPSYYMRGILHGKI